MKYDHSKERSVEFLRLALPLMSRQNAPLHPISYAIWYEYVSGRNTALAERLHQFTGNDARLTDEETQKLYSDFVAELDDESAQRIGSELQQVMHRIMRSTSVAGDEAADFGATLSRWFSELAPETRAMIQGDKFQRVMGVTRRIQDTLVELKGRLDESHAEIETLRAEVARVREEAMSDMLTGLSNRRAFEVHLANMVCSAGQSGGTRSGLSLIIADIDRFKQVNDTYGHLFGDKVLRSVGQILKANTKGRDIVARYGGEEFAVLLPDTRLPGAIALADALRNAVERGCVRRIGDENVLDRVTISLGVAAYCAPEGSAEFLRRADEALYRAKREGRNRVSAAPTAARAVAHDGAAETHLANDRSGEPSQR